MSDLSQFPITNRWPPKDRTVIQLYSVPTPNGLKVSIALEEMGLAYEPHKLHLSDATVRSPEFLSLSPNNKIPAIIDPNGPDGQPIGLFESGAILLYLAEKSGQFGGDEPAQRSEVTQWLMWQMSGLGPMFGQLGYFAKFAGAEIEDPRPRERFIKEAIRLLTVLETRLTGRDWVAGAYSIADMAIAPWLGALDFYGVKDQLGWDALSNLIAYQARFNERPGVQRGRET